MSEINLFIMLSFVCSDRFYALLCLQRPILLERRGNEGVDSPYNRWRLP